MNDLYFENLSNCNVLRFMNFNLKFDHQELVFRTNVTDENRLLLRFSNKKVMSEVEILKI